MAHVLRRLARASPQCTDVRRLARLFSNAVATPDVGLYPGGIKIPFTSTLDTHPPNAIPTMPCFRIMDENGNIRPDATDPDVGRDMSLRIYTTSECACAGETRGEYLVPASGVRPPQWCDCRRWTVFSMMLNGKAALGAKL